jgi:hypothetical protein
MKRFFIMTRGRTGSTAIIDELNNVKGIAAAQELFIDRNFKQLKKKTLLKAYPSFIPFGFWKTKDFWWKNIWKRSPDNKELLGIYLKEMETIAQRKGAIAFGFKVLSHHFDQTPLLKEILINQGYHVIYLTRNIPRQVISGIIAKKRGIYNRKHFQDNVSYQVDINEFEKLVKWEAKAIKNDLAFIRACNFNLLEISYEEYLNNRKAFFARILNFIGIPFELPNASDYSIMIPDLRHTVSNIDEVLEKVSEMGTNFDFQPPTTLSATTNDRMKTKEKENLFTLRNPESRFKILGDRTMFFEIVRDMYKNGGELIPADCWWNHDQISTRETESGNEDKVFDDSYSKLEMMLQGLVGISGMKPINENTVGKYESMLRSIDHLGMLPEDIIAHGSLNDWRETDLGSLMDVNLISAYWGHYEKQRDSKIKICEVGGGYGRLAEAMVVGLSEFVHYVLVDAVPATLMYAYLYLKKQFPELKIGSYYAGDVYCTDYNFYVMPSWQEQILPCRYFDICINIESMQEMEQKHINYFFAMFDRITKEDGLLYLSNARDYIFRGNWPIPTHWESLFLNNTPRSWTADHPTHILRKSIGDYSVPRSMLEALFRQQIADWNNRTTIQKLNRRIAEEKSLCAELQKKLDRGI